MTTLRSIAKAVHDRVFKNHVYEVEHGYMRGYLRRGRMPWFQRDVRNAAHRAEEAFFNALDMTGKVAYDVGSNLGTHTVVLTRLVGPSGAVHAFEPDPIFHAKLIDTIALNHLTNVRVHPIALGDEPGVLTLVVPKSGSIQMSATLSRKLQSKLRESDTHRTSEVRVVRLDDWLPVDVPPPDFMKVDVEGFELDVLRGAMETLRRSRPMLFIEIHGAGADDQRLVMRQVLQLLAPLGYRFHHLEADRDLDEHTADLPAGGHLVGRVAPIAA